MELRYVPQPQQLLLQLMQQIEHRVDSVGVTAFDLRLRRFCSLPNRGMYDELVRRALAAEVIAS